MNPAELPQSRHWSTWDAGRPAEFMHLPSGLRVAPLAYAASTGKATAFPPGPNVTFGAHAVDSSLVDLRLAHAGTSLAWSYRKPDPLTLTGSWTTVRSGEWGLRFWLNLCFAAPENEEWHFDRLDKTLHVEWAGGFFAIACLEQPLLTTAHQDLSALVAELEREGYWYLASRAERGRFIVLRFNLEHAGDNRFAIAYAERLDEAKMKAKAALAAPVASAGASNSLSAARDIIAWNTVWDFKNHRPYTSCSRYWDLGKFGGFGTWLTDTAVSALVHSLFGLDQARENLEALLAGQTEHGNFPCLLTGNDAWIDRSQPPLVSLIVWLIYQRTGSRELIELMYEPLLRNHLWWWRTRDGNGDGLLEYGSSSVGGGLYVGTKLAAKNESFMDNSPVHDEARWIEPARTLDCADVGLNSLIALDAEMLGRLAEVLGRKQDAEAHQLRAANHAALVRRYFWDDTRGIFANRLWSGKFVASLAPTSFFPLLIAAADDAQIASLMRHLSDQASFGGPWGLPSVAMSDPAFADNVYWRGRIWPILNWLVWLGLKRNGLTREAEGLRNKTDKLFAAAWNSRLAPENFNALTGAALDQPDTDPFYSWTALLPLMASADLVDVDPWQGWCLRSAGEDVETGPMITPSGPMSIARTANRLEMRQEGKLVLSTSIAPHITQFQMGERLTFVLPQKLAAGAMLRTSRPLARAAQNGRPLPVLDGREVRPRATGTQPELLEIDWQV